MSIVFIDTSPAEYIFKHTSCFSQEIPIPSKPKPSIAQISQFLLSLPSLLQRKAKPAQLEDFGRSHLKLEQPRCALLHSRKQPQQSRELFSVQCSRVAGMVSVIITLLPALQPAPYTILTPHSTLYNLHFNLYTLSCTLFTLHSIL